MLVAGGDNINSCRVDTAMIEDISELGDVLFDTVKCTGEKVTEIMRKYFLRVHPCLFAKIFHFSPNVRAAHLLTGSGYKYGTRCNFLPAA